MVISIITTSPLYPPIPLPPSPPPPPIAMATNALSTTIAVLAFVSSVLAAAAAPIPLLALLTIKSSLSDPLGALHDWSYVPGANLSISGEPSWCSWRGVGCTNGDVTSLDLSSNNLSGTFAAELRLLSPTLVHLNLSRNAFSGPLPPVLFDLTHLRMLDISHNDFNSTLSDDVAKLRCLVVLDAYSNSFTGPVPSGIGRLHHQLEHLNLGGSFFVGSIPVELGALRKLRFLHLAGNMLTGHLLTELGELTLLEHMEIGYNSFAGGVPPEFGMLTNLRYLDISSANLSGKLPSELGNPSLMESLFLFKNRFSGTIPASFSSLTAMKVLDLSDNHLSGEIPSGLSDMLNLTILSLMNNELSGEIPAGIGRLPELQTLLLWNNSLSGTLPQDLGLNRRLEKLDVSSNLLTGPIPQGLCSGNRLARLILFSNRFHSEIPPVIVNCSSLWRVRIEGNFLVGRIPTGFGSIPNLTYLDLSSNSLSGDIPADLATAPRLEYLNLSSNPLESPLPAMIWSAPSLQILSASFTGLTGEIPSFKIGCRNMYKIELQGNELGGVIPSDIRWCQKLLALKLNRNRLTGSIPPELSELPSIADVDLSWNELTGTIPTDLDNCSTLESLNISYNNLTGSVPSSGTVLRNLHPSSFSGNAGLCGELVGRPCDAKGSSPEVKEQPTARGSAGAAIVWIAAGAVATGLVVLIVGARWTRQGEEELGPGPWRLTTFQHLNFTAEDVAASVSMNDQIIGMGSTGIVYRAKMPNGESIAVKKLWGPQKEDRRLMRRKGGVVTEVEVLSSVRHRNIVRLLGYCTNRETMLLLYEYMPNGSLEDLLHRSGGRSSTGKLGGSCVTSLDWAARYRIAVGIAQGLCYLHHDFNPVIVHRDLKPSNILLDAEMEARIADFGVAKLIRNSNQTMSVIAGSCGYIAPEYAYTLQVDEKCDIYSYGVVLMEMVTGRRPVEAAYGEGSTIVDWVRASLARDEGKGPWVVLDKEAGAGSEEVREEMLLALRIALLCTSKNPKDRPSMRDVLSMLKEAKPNRKEGMVAQATA